MAIKDFIISGTYSRIEKLNINKKERKVDCELSIYKDSTLKEVLIPSLSFVFKDDKMSEKCPDCLNGFILTDVVKTDAQGVPDTVKENMPCEKCKATGYIEATDFTSQFESTLREDGNLLAICYNMIMQRPEFENTGEC